MTGNAVKKSWVNPNLTLRYFSLLRRLRFFDSGDVSFRDRWASAGDELGKGLACAFRQPLLPGANMWGLKAGFVIHGFHDLLRMDKHLQPP